MEGQRILTGESPVMPACDREGRSPAIGGIAWMAGGEGNVAVWISLASARMPREGARGGMARGDRGEARRAKSGGFGAVPLDFTKDAPRGSAGSFTSQFQ
jgi:hypothetical protein